jgi:hypothetical protein
MNAREKLDEFAEMRGWDKNKLIGWSEAADFAEWFAASGQSSVIGSVCTCIAFHKSDECYNLGCKAHRVDKVIPPPPPSDRIMKLIEDQSMEWAYGQGTQLGEEREMVSQSFIEGARLVISLLQGDEDLMDMIGSSIPQKPKPPLSKVLKEGGGHFCNNCNSTSSKVGFLGLFGERLCDNQECPNSRPKKNYR